MDAARYAVRLHATRGVHGIAPDVEHELGQTDDSAHAGPTVHSDPELDLMPTVRVKLVNVRAHIEGQPGSRLRVIRTPPRDSRDAHEVVADGADLLHAVILGEEVKAREDLVEERDKLLRVELLGEHRGADDVREKHRRMLIRIGDRALAGLEARRDLPWQHV